VLEHVFVAQFDEFAGTESRLSVFYVCLINLHSRTILKQPFQYKESRWKRAFVPSTNPAIWGGW
jgi:hypothetical protein